MEKTIRTFIILGIVFLGIICGIVIFRVLTNDRENTVSKRPLAEPTEEADSSVQLGEYKDTDFAPQISRDMMDKYGVPKENFVTLSLRDPGERLDFAFINGLTQYIARSRVTSEELMKEMTGYFWPGKAYEETKQDVTVNSDQIFEGWGERYMCKEPESGEEISGFSYTGSFNYGSEERSIEDCEAEIQTLCDQFQIGVNGTDAFDIRICKMEEYPEFDAYQLVYRIDGIPLNGNFYMNRADEDGVRYYVKETDFNFKDNRLISFDGIFSSSVSERRGSKLSFSSLEEVENVLKKAIVTPNPEITEIYDLEPLCEIYALGITKDQGFVLTPWEVFIGTHAIYDGEQSVWMQYQYDMTALNLINGNVKVIGANQDFLEACHLDMR